MEISSIICYKNTILMGGMKESIRTALSDGQDKKVERKADP